MPRYAARCLRGLLRISSAPRTRCAGDSSSKCPSAMGRWAPPTHASCRHPVVFEMHALVKEQHAAIADRLERGDVAAIETAAHAGARAVAGQLHLGLGAWTQPRVRLDKRRT